MLKTDDLIPTNVPRRPLSSTVPMNIDYAIHRYGEWTMLMLGETVLSLLIVGVYVEHGFYKIVYCGILTISLLNTMHFRSQPHHADDHAMRRKMERGISFSCFQCCDELLPVLPLIILFLIIYNQ